MADYQFSLKQNKSGVSWNLDVHDYQNKFVCSYTIYHAGQWHVGNSFGQEVYRASTFGAAVGFVVDNEESNPFSK